MVRHRWETRDAVRVPRLPAPPLRALLNRGTLLVVLVGAVVWVAASLVLWPVQGTGRELGRVDFSPGTGADASGDASGQGAGDRSAEARGDGPQEAANDARGADAGTGAPAGGGAAPPTGAGATAAGGTAQAGSATGGSGPRGGTVVVHVAGAVADPGVYTLPAGTRAHEAVAAAGGLARHADESAVNLAAPVVDGQQLLIPVRGAAPPAAASGPGAPPPTGTAPAPVNLNTADAAALEELPGIGPALAARIVEFRERNGPFASVAELDAVSGIGPAVLAELEPLVAAP